MEHEEYRERLGPFALDTLDEAEKSALQAHLAECVACRAELDQWREVIASLAYTITPVEPPAELRARILERVRNEGQVSPAAVTTSEANTKGASHRDQVRPNISTFPQTRRRWVIIPNFVMLSGALAASIAVAALVLSLVILWHRNNELRAEMARLSSSLNETREALAREREDRELIAAPDASIATLVGTNVALRARARLVYDPRTGRVILFAYDLPPAPAGKAYQLWFIANGKPLPGHVFTTDAVGRAEMRDSVPAEGRNVTLFAVTLEPSTGASAPTGDKYLLSLHG